jgi:hypothetical protein
MFSALLVVAIAPELLAFSTHWITCGAKIASVLFFLAVHSVV